MPTVTVRHKVKDYAKWKAVYDEKKSMVKSKGGKRQKLYRNSVDPSELVILTEFADMNMAKGFANSDELKQAMMSSGVANEPTVFFLEEIEDTPL